MRRSSAARLGYLAAAVLVALSLARGACMAQTMGSRGGLQSATQSPTPGQQPVPSLNAPQGNDDGSRDRLAKLQEDQEKTRNSDRQKKLVADTERLLALATDLKTDVDKTNKDMLSVDVIRKADEIEKLAHSVKERMKGN